MTKQYLLKIKEVPGGSMELSLEYGKLKKIFGLKLSGETVLEAEGKLLDAAKWFILRNGKD
jgi:hypothetical protein